MSPALPHFYYVTILRIHKLRTNRGHIKEESALEVLLYIRLYNSSEGI